MKLKCFRCGDEEDVPDAEADKKVQAAFERVGEPDTSKYVCICDECGKEMVERGILDPGFILPQPKYDK